jgi:flagellar biosynthesis/type III secretory pathway protein FliH
MCKIVEEIADQKFEAGRQEGRQEGRVEGRAEGIEEGTNRQIDNSLRACSEDNLSLAFMVKNTGKDEASVIKRLGELGLPIPKS